MHLYSFLSHLTLTFLSFLLLYLTFPWHSIACPVRPFLSLYLFSSVGLPKFAVSSNTSFDDILFCSRKILIDFVFVYTRVLWIGFIDLFHFSVVIEFQGFFYEKILIGFQ